MAGCCDSDGTEEEGFISIQFPAVLLLCRYATGSCLCIV